MSTSYRVAACRLALRVHCQEGVEVARQGLRLLDGDRVRLSSIHTNWAFWKCSASRSRGLRAESGPRSVRQSHARRLSLEGQLVRLGTEVHGASLLQSSRARVGSRSGSTDLSFRRQQDRLDRVDAAGETVRAKARLTEKSPKWHA